MQSKTKERFIQYLMSDYQHFCMHRGHVPRLETLIGYLVEREIIDPAKVRNFAIQGDFRRLATESVKRTKSEIVQELAETYEMHQSSIWLILRKNNSK